MTSCVYVKRHKFLSVDNDLNKAIKFWGYVM